MKKELVELLTFYKDDIVSFEERVCPDETVLTVKFEGKEVTFAVPKENIIQKVYRENKQYKPGYDPNLPLCYLYYILIKREPKK